MYANSSDSYWQQRQQKHGKKSPLLLVACVLFFLAVAIATLLHRNSTSGGTLTARRSLSQTSEQHWKLCESRVDSQSQCDALCLPERNSVARKTMHQACLHGCKSAHVSSASLACRGKVKSEEEIFQEVGGLAYLHCQKHQTTEPKPDVFAACRKHHRAGVKSGFRLGAEMIQTILDEEWEAVQSGLDAEDQDSGMLWKE